MAVNLMTSIDFKAMLEDERRALQGSSSEHTRCASPLVVHGGGVADPKRHSRGLVGLVGVAKKEREGRCNLPNVSLVEHVNDDIDTWSATCSDAVINTTVNLGPLSEKSVPCRIGGIYYYPDFISQEEETALITAIEASPVSSWTQLTGRRLQNWGGVPSPDGMVPVALPSFMPALCYRLYQVGVRFCYENECDQVDHTDQCKCYPNHVLLNEYQAGQVCFLVRF